MSYWARADLAVAALIFGATTARAETPDGCGSAPAVFAATPRLDSLAPQPRRVRPTVFLGDYVTIGVCRLDSLLIHAKVDQQPLTLFVNGVDFGLAPVEMDHERSSVTFTLDRTAENKPLWKNLLYNPLFDRTSVVRVGIGVRGGRQVPALPGARNDFLLDKLWVDAWLVVIVSVLLVSIVALGWLSLTTDLLRDGARVGPIRQTYSLGRTQMAWWFALGLVGFVVIWLVDGDVDTITPSLLALMGISAATGLTAAVITPSSTSRADAARAEHRDQLAAIDLSIASLSERLAETERRLVTLRAAGEPLTDAERESTVLGAKTSSLRTARDELEVRLASIGPVLASRGFWRDMLSDDRGVIALDRLQIVCWTAVLSVLFLYSVFFDLAIPEFNSTLLILLGISSGTYLGFKLPAARS
jgi:hypothetical protein